MFNNNFKHYVYKAADDNKWNDVFNPVKSQCEINDSNNQIISKKGWPVAHTRLHDYSGPNEGYGYDCVVGLGSINACGLQNYIMNELNNQ